MLQQNIGVFWTPHGLCQTICTDRIANWLQRVNFLSLSGSILSLRSRESLQSHKENPKSSLHHDVWCRRKEQTFYVSKKGSFTFFTPPYKLLKKNTKRCQIFGFQAINLLPLMWAYLEEKLACLPYFYLFKRDESREESKQQVLFLHI